MVLNQNHFLNNSFNLKLFSKAKDFYLYFKEFIPDLIITDISLPNESGLDILQYIKNKNSNIKVLVFTAYDKPSFIYSALKLKADGYLTKDASESELLFAINCVLNNKKYFSKNVSDIIIENMIDNDENKILKESEKLNENEILLIQLIAKEYTQDEISLKMRLNGQILG